MAYAKSTAAAAWLALVSLSVVACTAKDTADGPDQRRSASELGHQGNALTTEAQAAFPAARIESGGGRVNRIHSATLATGATAVEAAERLRQTHAAVFGVSPNELQPVDMMGGKRVSAAAPKAIELMYDRKTRQYKFSLYRYQQVNNGVPVHDSELLALVRNGGQNPVVWASSSVQNLGSFSAAAPARTPAADTAKTLQAIRSNSNFVGRPLAQPTQLQRLSTPELVVFAGTQQQAAAPSLAIRYTAESDSPPGKWLVVASANTGDVLSVEHLIVFDNVLGRVDGNVTSGAKAMQCANELPTALPYAQVSAAGGAMAETDVSGAFSLVNSGVDPISLTSVLGGRYFDVTNAAGSNALLTQLVTPPGPANFLQNLDNTDDAVRAQANGYANANQARDFLLSYLPSYPTIATQLDFPVKVNRSDNYCPGNAWYDYSSINFCVASATYANTSFASVSQHEYGHHIITSGGSGQGEYGEGMADTIAALIAKDPGLGYGFYLAQCDSPLRNANNTCQYLASGCSSCGSEAHACGNLISGTIWSIRSQLQTTEPTAYDDILTQLVLSSIPLHAGTGINASIAVDLLTLDDNDGTIANGTPHYTEICAGFAAHAMSCPPILSGLGVTPSSNLAAEGPTAGPFVPASLTYTLQNLGPETSLSYQVAARNNPTWLTLGNATGSIPLGQTAQVTVAINQVAAAGLNAGSYSSILDFTNLTTGIGNQTHTAKLKVGTPLPVYRADFEAGLDNFTLTPGATTQWHRATGCAATQPGHGAAASLYFGTDSTCTFANGSNRVQGTADSPVIALLNTEAAELRFNYFLQTEGGTTWDRATVQVSVNGGSYTTVASNGGGGVALNTSASWTPVTIDLSALLAGMASANLQLRLGFDSVDGVANAYTGFLVDDIELRAFGQPCTSSTTCNDGLFCNGTETCVAGTCQAGTPVLCNDGVSCTVDTCNETTHACQSPPNDALCGDGSVCNGLETCAAVGGCQPGTPLNCNDNNACTTDSCNPATGCATTPVVCNDNNACTTDSCNPATGCATTPVVCNDNNACTTDSCNPATGCATTPVVCNDNNPCTTDSCNAATGCTFTNNTGACGDDGNSCTTDICSAGTCTHPDNGTCGSGAFQESGGQVVIEAEHFHTNVPRASHTWDLTSNTQYSGGQFMQANPNNNTNVNTGYVSGSPELKFSINFVTTGTYNVWLRGLGATLDDDSCHAGIDGTGPASADRIGNFSTTLGWTRSTADGPVATLVINTAGVHTLSIWMREDGLRLDKLLLTTNASFTPSGAGPSESPRQGAGCTSDASCNDNNPCTADTCASGSCKNTAVSNGTACTDDGNTCTTDSCNAGTCAHANNTAPCTDDGNTCTSDVCAAGACTHPSNGTCTTPSPCSAYCTNPTSFSGNFSSGNLGTAATCHQTTGAMGGGNCGNFAGGRTLKINGTTMTCNGSNWSSLPAKVNGGYCVYTNAGNQAWAYFSAW